MSEQESLLQLLSDALVALFAIFADDVVGWFFSFF